MAGPRRPVDWTTAWETLVPVYGVSIVAHALAPLFSVPGWVLFGVYAYKVLESSRLAVDPWRGRGSPRPYLVTWAASLIVHFTTFASLGPSSGSGSFATVMFSGLVVFTTAAVFVGSSAPPQVRGIRAWTALGVAAAILSAGIVPIVTSGLIGVSGPIALGAFASQTGLAIVSFVAFMLAGHKARKRSPIVARKAPATRGDGG